VLQYGPDGIPLPPPMTRPLPPIPDFKTMVKKSQTEREDLNNKL